MQTLYQEFGNKKFEVVGIFVAEDMPGRGADLLRRYIAEHHVTFPVVMGERITAVNYLGIGPSRPQYHVPTFFFVGPDGQILEERDPDMASNQAWFGSLEANLEATIRRLMPADPPAGKKGSGGKKASRVKKSGASTRPAP